ncbi:trypsin-like peptidase domain-containing protein [Flagellimonas lutimaris]|uniref:trypsin-like peptidase domain-containing protein n=1 Tax=Flagellimonas lutimaris TaxID=475082 RepID=UPI003F5CD1B3
MKYLIATLTILYSISAYSQSDSMMDIPDYSYFLFEMRNNDMKQGTGFFIKKDNKTYLVTAAHNFHVDKTATNKTTNEFYLRLKKKGKTALLLINNNPLPKTEVTKNLDINFYEINIPSDYEINIIDLVPDKIVTPENIICYGYAVVDGNEDNPQLYVENLKPTEFKGKVKFEYQKPIKYFETQEKDYHNYVVKYEVDSLGRGTSGAPVFSINKKNGFITYHFAGLIHTRNELTKIATILRPEKIVELIKGIE